MHVYEIFLYAMKTATDKDMYMVFKLDYGHGGMKARPDNDYALLI